MRFVTAKYREKTFIGKSDDINQDILDLHMAKKKMNGIVTIPPTLLECIALGDRFLELVATITNWVNTEQDKDCYYYPSDQVTLLAPIPRPNKNVFCVGKNYRDHVLEMGSEADIPEHIMIFTKVPTTIIGQNDTIPLHAGIAEQLDYEGELAIVIGKKGRDIEEADAMDYVFGYTIVNDITARDLQVRHKQFFLGKSLDGTCPCGPAIVHKSAIPHPDNLMLETTVNGEIRQQANTSMMIFSIPEIIAIISRGMTLEPGDIIATGTPAGVGKGFNPPRFLKAGDVVEITLEGIGRLRNTVE